MIGRAAVAKVAMPVVAGAVLVTTALVVLPGDAQPASAVGHAWIDDPLSGAVLTDGDAHVVAHVADPTGVGQIRFYVDDQQVDTSAGKGARLVLTTFTSQLGPGPHVLRVQATGVGGAVGAPGVVSVTVGASSGRTPVDESADGVATTVATPSTTSIAPTTTVRSTSVSSTTSSPTTSSTVTTTVTVTTVTTVTTTAPPRTTTTTMPRTTTTTSVAARATTTTAPPTSSPPTTSPPTTSPACAPGAPVPIAPLDLQVVYVGPTLTWRAPTGCAVSSYEVQVSLVPSFDRLEVDQAGITSTSWGPGPLSQCGPYYWRVRALGGTGIVPTYGPWSATGSYRSGARGC